MQVSRRFKATPMGTEFPMAVTGDVWCRRNELSATTKQPVTLAQRRDRIGDVFYDMIHDDRIVCAGYGFDRTEVNAQSKLSGSVCRGRVYFLSLDIPTALAKCDETLAVAATNVEQASWWRLIEAHQGEAPALASDRGQVYESSVDAARKRWRIVGNDMCVIASVRSRELVICWSRIDPGEFARGTLL